MGAANAYRERMAEEVPLRTNRLTMNGEPVRETLADLLSPVSFDRGWSKTAMVEVLRRYSNRPELLKPMQDVLRRTAEGDRTDAPGIQSTGSGGGSASVRDRLSEADVREIVRRFRAGEPKHRLAAEYGMSLSTIKRLLRRHR
jgi:hypothetical protein